MNLTDGATYVLTEILAQAGLITDVRSPSALSQASVPPGGSTKMIIKALPEGRSPLMTPTFVEQMERASPEPPLKYLPSLESLSPSVGTVTPRPWMSGGRGAIDERAASAQGMLEGRGTSSRASVLTPTSLRRGGSVRESAKHHDHECTCSCATQDGPRSVSRRSSITRALSLRRKKPSIDTSSPPRTADSTATAPAFIPQRPVSPPAPDSAYSSGESIDNTHSSSSPEPDRICSPAPTFTSDLYHSAKPSSSRLHDGKAAAVMGTLQRNGSSARNSTRERELRRERDMARTEGRNTIDAPRPSIAASTGGRKSPLSPLSLAPRTPSRMTDRKGFSIFDRAKRRLTGSLSKWSFSRKSKS